MNEAIKFTTKEMRMITGIAAKNIWNYKTRGHLFQDSNKLYPLDNDLNRSFIEQYGLPGELEKAIKKQQEKHEKDRKKNSLQSKKPKKPKKTTVLDKNVTVSAKKVTKPKININEKVKRETKAKEVKIREKKVPVKEKEEKKETELSEIAKVNLEQKKLSIERARADYELKQIELEQKRGTVISLEKIIIITENYSDKFKRELLERIKTFVQDICARHDIETGKAGEYKLKIAGIINDSSEKATNELLKNIESL